MTKSKVWSISIKLLQLIKVRLDEPRDQTPQPIPRYFRKSAHYLQKRPKPVFVDTSPVVSVLTYKEVDVKLVTAPDYAPLKWVLCPVPRCNVHAAREDDLAVKRWRSA